jgi:hypothetical protein
VVECIFLLQQDNVISQALLDSWGESDNLCTKTPNAHDGIQIDGPSHIHYELVPPLPVASNHVISAIQQGHQAFPLVKVKTTNGTHL